MPETGRRPSEKGETKERLHTMSLQLTKGKIDADNRTDEGLEALTVETVNLMLNAADMRDETEVNVLANMAFAIFLPRFVATASKLASPDKDTLRQRFILARIMRGNPVFKGASIPESATIDRAAAETYFINQKTLGAKLLDNTYGLFNRAWEVYSWSISSQYRVAAFATAKAGKEGGRKAYVSLVTPIARNVLNAFKLKRAEKKSSTEKSALEKTRDYITKAELSADDLAALAELVNKLYADATARAALAVAVTVPEDDDDGEALAA